MRAEKSPAGTPGAGSPIHTAVVSRTVSRAQRRPRQVAGREVVERARPPPSMGDQTAGEGATGRGRPGSKVTRVLTGAVGDALQRGDHVGRGHLGAAAALELGLVGPPADHRDPRRR